MVVQTFIVYTVEETQKNIIERMTQKIVIFCASRPILYKILVFKKDLISFKGVIKIGGVTHRLGTYDRTNSVLFKTK